MSRARKGQRSNRGARIITTIFSIIIVVSFVLSLIGPSAFRTDEEPTPAFPTVAPVSSPTPSASATPTAGVPTPVLVPIPTATP